MVSEISFMLESLEVRLTLALHDACRLQQQPNELRRGMVPPSRWRLDPKLSEEFSNESKGSDFTFRNVPCMDTCTSQEGADVSAQGDADASSRCRSHPAQSSPPEDEAAVDVDDTPEPSQRKARRGVFDTWDDGSASECVSSKFANLFEFRAIDTYSEDDTRRKKAACHRAKVDESLGSLSHMAENRWAAIVTSSAFETVMATVIVADLVCMGIQVELEASRRGQPLFHFYVIDALFACIFTLELLLRLFALRCEVFMQQYRGRICLDIFLVVAALIQTSVQTFAWATADRTQDTGKLGTLQVIRILRVTRPLRALRMTKLVHVLASLRILTTSIRATLQSLMWALLLLLMIIYVMALIFTQATTDYLQQAASNKVLEDFWGTVPIAMLTLFKAISGGVSWHDVAEPLGGISLWLTALFASYIFLTYFAVLNVITGVFCQSAIETVGLDPDLGAQAILQRKRRVANKLRSLFGNVDTDASGHITITELENLLSHEHMQAYLAAMGVDVDDAWSIFKLIDKDQNLSIDVKEFVSGIMRLQGNATSFEVQTVMDSQRWMARQMTSFMDDIRLQWEKAQKSARVQKHPR